MSPRQRTEEWRPIRLPALVGVTVAALMSASVGATAAETARPPTAGTTYYINNLQGAGGKNENPGTSEKAPWLDYYDTLGHEGLAFENIFVHDCCGIFTRDMPDGPAKTEARKDRAFLSSGILITATALKPAAQNYVLRKVRFDFIEGTHNGDSISIDPFSDGGVGGDFWGCIQDFEGNGVGGQSAYAGSLFHAGNVAGGVIRDNLFYEHGLPMFKGDFSKFKLEDNLDLKQNFHNSMNGFSNTQGTNGWFYQTRSKGGAWTNAESYDAVRQAWEVGKGGVQACIGRFEQRATAAVPEQAGKGKK